MTGVNRPMSQMRKLEAKEALFRTRKRILKYLVLGFIKQEGYMNTAETFTSEAGITDEYVLCDNIDLDIILQDYCSYYLIRFNKQPQFCRKVDERPVKRPHTRRTRREPEVEQDPGSGDAETELPAMFTVTKLLKESVLANTEAIPTVDKKPFACLMVEMAPEKRQLAEYLYKDILRVGGVSWTDIKGLEDAKTILMESVVYPLKYPEVFTGLLEPWRGVLLHGPPGTGKTLLARAVCGEGCTFFNITCSSIINKWRGESEKIVKVLFELASYYAPSIVFMDEAECVTSRRGQHEASRRLTSQLLVEMDGVCAGRGVFVLLTSNMPWEIDPAILRRLEKRIFIPLPDLKTRTELFEMYLSSDNIELVPKINFEELAAKTEGYSGSDIKLVCKEALMTGVRKMMPHMNKSSNSRKDKITLSDILTAIEKTKPVSKSLEKKHEEWQKEMGSA
ncbi:unnamed protein product [Danaus chrysippus]|uniref:(African queen) hypothetical protein n=1 Tax=Danaus chrysippus TaxID=151541 RepID=A0A8J2W3J6_9NEOP|nr:unnamed protein product [Danaus chrysippus]